MKHQLQILHAYISNHNENSRQNNKKSAFDENDFSKYNHTFGFWKAPFAIRLREWDSSGEEERGDK